MGEEIFEYLEQSKDEIDLALGVPVIWSKQSDGRGFVQATKNFPGGLLEDSRVATRDWLADIVPRFITVFRPRVEAFMKAQSE